MDKKEKEIKTEDKNIDKELKDFCEYLNNIKEIDRTSLIRTRLFEEKQNVK
jgi:hypothetical protein